MLFASRLLAAAAMLSLLAAGCSKVETVDSGSYVYPVPPEVGFSEEIACARLEVDIENLSATLIPVGKDAIDLVLEPVDESEWEESCHSMGGSALLEAFTVVSPDPIVVGETVFESPSLVAGCGGDFVSLEGDFEDPESGETHRRGVSFQLERKVPGIC